MSTLDPCQDEELPSPSHHGGNVHQEFLDPQRQLNIQVLERRPGQQPIDSPEERTGHEKGSSIVTELKNSGFAANLCLTVKLPNNHL